MAKLASKEPHQTLYLQAVRERQDTNARRDRGANFNEHDQASTLTTDFLEDEETKFRITPPRRKKSSIKDNLEETIDDLWNIVHEIIINTEAARKQTTNVSHQKKPGMQIHASL